MPIKNVELFPKLDRVRSYQLRCSFLLAAVPLLCAVSLAALLYFFAQQNLYFLENGGMLIDDAIRGAYHHQIQEKMLEVIWYVGALIGLTFLMSVVIMNWAVSPFMNAERLLRAALSDPEKIPPEHDYLSESPLFHRVIWGLAKRLRDTSYPFDEVEPPNYRFNARFYVKFVVAFFIISVMTGYILGIIFNTVYLKIIEMAITLVNMRQRGYYFVAQEELLQIAVTMMTVISCVAYAVIGFYVARYMSNMVFVFTRAVKEHHFPLKLRHSDIYHGLADSISEVAAKAKLETHRR